MGEARSGVVHLTGEKEGRPIHTGFSHGDAVAGLMGSHAVLAALYRRSVDPDFSGEWIDLALFEPLFRLVEWQVIVHDQLGTIPNRSGNQLAVAPAAVVNTYRTSEGEWITVTTATRRSVRRVAELVDMTSEDYESLADEAALRDALDHRLQDWVAARPTTTALAELAAHEVVASRIFHMGDIARDSTYTEREDIVTVPDPDLGPVRMQAVIPHAHNHPGDVWRTGPQLGQDTALVLGEWLGIGEDRRRALASRRVILEQVSAGT